MIHNAEHYERPPRGSRVHLRGVVASGLGRAHVFMAQPHYQNQFKRVLRAGAWPGTLNISLYGDNLADYKSLRVLAGLEEGEGAEGRSRSASAVLSEMGARSAARPRSRPR